MEQHRSGFVSLLGRPNSGKSTLLNTMLEQKISIVSDKPQTTRNRILGIVTRSSHQIIFVDTPGIHEPLYEMNRRMMAATRAAAEGMDLIVLLVDGTTRYGRGDAFVIDMLSRLKKPTLLVINKIDMMSKPELLPLVDRYRVLYPFEEIIPASALTGENKDLLEREVARRLPEGPCLFSQDLVTDLPERFLVAEMIRERILKHTREELPYATGVVVEQFEDAQAPAKTVIHAAIYVERDSQKGIIIGKQASLLKLIGTEARKDVEKLLASPVYLSLQVKVRKDWRNNPRLLGAMGVSGD